MGILSDGINEVIATTRGNAAPMGIICREGMIRMICFSGSHTARNIARDRWVVANLLHDAVIYVRTAFSDPGDLEFIDEDINGTSVSRLADAEAFVVFSAIIEHRGTESMAVRLLPLQEKVVSCRPHPINRGFSGIIEATVHGTRYMISKDPALKDLIDHHAAIIRRCGGKRELEALALLESFLEKADDTSRKIQ